MSLQKQLTNQWLFQTTLSMLISLPNWFKTFPLHELTSSWSQNSPRAFSPTPSFCTTPSGWLDNNGCNWRTSHLVLKIHPSLRSRIHVCHNNMLWLKRRLAKPLAFVASVGFLGRRSNRNRPGWARITLSLLGNGAWGLKRQMKKRELLMGLGTAVNLFLTSNAA